MQRVTKGRIAAICMVMALLPTTVYGSTNSSNKKEETQDKLNQTNREIKNLDELKKEVDKDINAAAANMEKLLGEQEALQTEIDDLSTRIGETEEKLAELEDNKQKNYDAMKVRIKYMYENGTDTSVWESILNAETVGDMLSKIEYVRTVYNKDRAQLDEYARCLVLEEQTRTELEGQLEDLMVSSESFAAQQEELEYYMVALQEKSDAYGDSIAKAEALAKQYEDTIWAIDNPTVGETGQTGTSPKFNGTIGGPNPISVSSANLDKSVKYMFDTSNNPGKQTSVSQIELVQYALSWVGSHYVWAGNILGCYDWSDGKGVDCSGFVHEVYKHFGIDTVRYSQSFKNVGKPVAYENIQPGDIVVYPGHVALYVGDGYIVEAQGKKAGVTANRLVSRSSSRITAIRRLL